MARNPNPLLREFLDRALPLPDLHWETVPLGVDPYQVWEGYDEGTEGWVPIWFPCFDPVSGRSYGEFERADYFNRELIRVLSGMHRWPLWGSDKQKKHAIAIALLHLYCELMNLCEKI